VHYAVWAPLIAFTATLLTLRLLSGSRLSTLVLDHPNQRSLHGAPVPRTGGIGLHLGVLLGWAIAAPDLPFQVGVAFGLLLLVSLIDDLRGVPVVLRFAAHLLLAGIVTTSVLALGFANLFAPGFGMLAIVTTALAIGWMTNLYNFMDGSDGLAGGMTVFGFGFYAWAAWLAENSAFALLNASIGASAAAFLVFNFHPARIFMGDVGSIPLGFLAGAFGLIGWREGLWNWWFPLLVFAPFMIDASVTLARRLLRRERVWEAHRDHYYQRLVQLGWGHRRTALAEYALMLASGTLALSLLSAPPTMQMVALAAAATVYATLCVYIERAWRRKSIGGALP
jgi:UDP-N-acetylmuramyl pentapeptide phosphotransferase/UDP-N-acetylglucosamine-1-phosphate transferase